MRGDVHDRLRATEAIRARLATELATLRAENARLREALDRIARKPWTPIDPTAPVAVQIWDMVRQIIQCASNALDPQEPQNLTTQEQRTMRRALVKASTIKEPDHG